MAHYVNRRGYWSLERSVREGKRVRKQIIRYYGKAGPPGQTDADARLAQMTATAERKAEEWNEYQRATFGETAAEARERTEREAQFSQEKFLEATAGQAVHDESAVNEEEGGEQDDDGDAEADEGHTI